MTKTVEIIPQVRLTPKQRLTLVHMANNGGKMEEQFEYKQTLTHLIYLRLVEQCKLHDETALAKRTAAAWRQLRAACRAKDSSAAEKAVDMIRHERWDRGRIGWRLTPAASEYLVRGRVTVTVGKSLTPPVETKTPVETKKAG